MKKRVCAIDVGTNTVLATVAESNEDGSIRALWDHEWLTGLGRGLASTGCVDPDGLERVSQAIAESVSMAQAHGVVALCAVGTSALREARDSADAIRTVQERTGVKVLVISGDEEAALTFAGAFFDTDAGASARRSGIDVGGGSTELVHGERGVLSACVSLPLGSVRLTDRWITHDPPSPAELDSVRRAIADALAGHPIRLEPPCVATAGTATTLFAFAANVDDPHGITLERDHLRNALSELGKMDTRERIAAGIPPGRARYVVAGGEILLSIAEIAGVSRLIASRGGVRWGLARAMLDGRAWKSQCFS